MTESAPKSDLAPLEAASPTEAGGLAQRDLLLPNAARLLHIGVHKSGTTSLQSAFFSARAHLGEHGVSYFGGPHHHPAIAVTGAKGLRGNAKASMADWEKLVSDVSAAGSNRVMVSSEFLSNASEDVARRVVTDLKDAGGPLHVVVTVRPMHRIAPSQWQQYVQNGIAAPYLSWLDGMFCQPPYEKPTPTFWRRHWQGELVRRWAAEVGAENVTVVVVDESDPGMLMRTFESLTGLPDGFLVPKSSQVNRSLSLGEVELLRRLNSHFKETKWSDADYAQFVRRGVVHNMKISRRPSPDEPKLRTPGWAMERAAEVGARDAETITALGVSIVGDISTLGKLPDDRPTVTEEEVSGAALAADAAEKAVIGALEVGIRAEKRAATLHKEAERREKQVVVLQKRAAKQVESLQKKVSRLQGEVTELENAEPTMDPFTAKALASELVRRVKARALRTVRLS